MEYDVVEGFWGDAGESIDAYYEVNDFVRRTAPTSDRRRCAAIPLRRFEDERGWLTELDRAGGSPKPMRQTNVSFSRAGVIRGLHYHERGQDDLFVCLQGTARVVVLDRRDGRDVHRGHRRREPGRDLRPRPLAHGFEALTDLCSLPRDRGVRPGRPGRARGAVERPARRRPVEHEIADPVGTGPGRVLITGAGGQLGPRSPRRFPTPTR